MHSALFAKSMLQLQFAICNLQTWRSIQTSWQLHLRFSTHQGSEYFPAGIHLVFFLWIVLRGGWQSIMKVALQTAGNWGRPKQSWSTLAPGQPVLASSTHEGENIKFENRPFENQQFEDRQFYSIGPWSQWRWQLINSNLNHKRQHWSHSLNDRKQHSGLLWTMSLKKTEPWTCLLSLPCLRFVFNFYRSSEVLINSTWEVLIINSTDWVSFSHEVKTCQKSSCKRKCRQNSSLRCAMHS